MTTKVRSKKLFLSVKDERFEERRQSSVITVLTDGSELYLNQYAKMFTDDEIGNFDLKKVGDLGVLEFFPIDSRDNEYSYSFISYDTKQNIYDYDSYNFGDTVSIATTHLNVGVSSSRTIYSIPSKFTSAKLLVELSSTSGEKYEYNEINLVSNGSDAYFSEFGRITLSNDLYLNQTGIGTYDVSLSGSNIDVIFNSNISDSLNCNVVLVSIADTNYNSSSSRLLRYADVKSTTVSIASSSSPNPVAITSYTSEYNLGYFIVQVTDITNNEIQISELIVLNNNSDCVITEYGNVCTSSQFLGEFDCSTSSLTELFFTPNPNIDVKVTILHHAVSYLEFSSYPVSINFKNAELSTGLSKFSSSSDISFKRDFNLNYNRIPIFERTFNGKVESTLTNPSGINLTTNLVYIPNHFFVSGEKVKYKTEIFDYLDFLTTQTTSTAGVGTNILEVLSTVGLTVDNYFNNNGNYISITNIDSNKISLGSTIGSSISSGVAVTFSELSSIASDDSDTPDTSFSVGIANTYISGVGVTNKLSGDLYVYKFNDRFIGFCTSPRDALVSPPKLINLTSVGIGNNHYVTSTNQNSKCLILIDNVIQSPIVSTAVTSVLTDDIGTIDTTLQFSGITSFFSGDLIKIDNEIMKITTVGVGTTNLIEVERPILGTNLKSHSINSLITKLKGNYNIVGSKIYFPQAPYGPIYDEVNGDINIRSTFQGRVFVRSGIPDSNESTYEKNYIFDDINSNFNAVKKDFELTSGNQDISGFSTSNGIILINNIFQNPEDDYTLSESLAQTNLNFTGTATSALYDPNNANVPRGGIIVSVGSSNGFGYQPLVSAGGTAVVSISGTIQSISIGNSGSGYRSSVQPIVRVGVQTSSVGTPSIRYIGTASVSNGRIVSIAITNPGSGYTSTNPPDVIFDAPLSYSDLNLKYSGTSSGIGSQAKIDIVVGQGSSVIDFTITNYGYSYNVGDVLTVESGGLTGIPTDTSKPFNEFSLTVEKVYNDTFSGWSLGELQKLDNIDSLFDNFRKTFPLIKDNNRFAIVAKKGSKIDLKSTLLIFLNDVLQKPGVAYNFNGGSNFTFTEAPKSGDKCRIIFYRGTPNIDVVDVDIVETVKSGDLLKVVGNTSDLIENQRIIKDILLPDTVETNSYNSVGVTSNLELLRPVNWYKQRNDLVIDGVQVNKNRIEYEPNIFPTCNLIKSVGIGSTQLFVDSVKISFDTKNENAENKVINKIEIIDNSNLVLAIATAIVSSAGTIQSLSIVDGGVGYTTTPSVSIQNPIGIGTTGKARLLASISGGSVTSISITSPGFGYSQTNPPTILIEPPTIKKEYLDNVSYLGDFGIISGIKTTNVGFASTGLVFDLYIPSSSYLRNSSVVETAITQSQIKQNYYFKVSNSKIGSGVRSLNRNGSVIGIGTTGIDNVYQVISVSSATTSVLGVGTTSVVQVVVSISTYSGISGFGYSSYYGDYSWGIINVPTTKNRFDVGTQFGVVGLNSTPVIRRYNPLLFTDFDSI
jgi:hypothetical protein